MGMDAAMGADFSRQLSNAGFSNLDLSGFNFSPVPQTKTTPPPAVSTEPVTDPNPQATPQVFSSPTPAPAPVYSVNPADNTPVVNTPAVLTQQLLQHILTLLPLQYLLLQLHLM